MASKVSDGVLGFLGVKQAEYEQARALTPANGNATITGYGTGMPAPTLASGVSYTDGVVNGVTAGQAYLNNLSNISKDGSRANEYSAWQAENGGKIDWSRTDLQGLLARAKTDSKVMQDLSAWAYSNPQFGGDQAIKDLGIDIEHKKINVPSQGVLGILGMTAEQYVASELQRQSAGTSSTGVGGFAGVGSNTGSVVSGDARKTAATAAPTGSNAGGGKSQATLLSNEKNLTTKPISAADPASKLYGSMTVADIVGLTDVAQLESIIADGTLSDGLRASARQRLRVLRGGDHEGL